GDVRSDLATRDFTINAMARQIGSDELVDPFHGLRDIAERQVRAVSPTVFRDDPVRLLRAIRLAGELGFSIEPRTEDWMRGDAALMAYASVERARDEFFKILAQHAPGERLRQADDVGILAALLPEINALKNVAPPSPALFDAFEQTLHAFDSLVEIQSREYSEVADGEFVQELRAHFAQTISSNHSRSTVLRVAALMHGVARAESRIEVSDADVPFEQSAARSSEMADAALRRLRFSNAEVDLVARIVREQQGPLQLAGEPVTNRAAYRLFRAAGDSGVDACVLALALERGRAPRVDPDRDRALRATNRALLERYYRAGQTVISPPALIDGRTLMRELGIGAGPRVGELLETIREAQVEGDVSSREQALALAAQSLKERPGRP
ncbi:MAG: hypothetical protein M1482_07905, partial [Chloroflexi bacterium]|nr:hypothetical protein [Chloroflexota bacterium]